MDKALLEAQLLELPLLSYFYIDPATLEISPRVRWICENECPMYGRSWACPPGTGTLEQCEKKCRGYREGLVIATVAEVGDIADIHETLATRRDHEEITNQVGDILRRLGAEPYILSTESCAECSRCAYLDEQPCRKPERMHPCVESQGINIIPTLEDNGIVFQYGSNVVTWISLLLY